MPSEWRQRIKEAREDKQISQEALSKLIGVAQQTVGGYESPTNPQQPDIATFIRIGEALGVNPCWLAFGPHYAEKTTNKDDTSLASRRLMEQTILVFERIVSNHYAGVPIPPQKRAKMLMHAYNLAELLGSPEKLAPELERLLSIALSG